MCIWGLIAAANEGFPSFASRLADWKDFFTTMAGATATLAGLVFIAVSVHLKALKNIADKKHR